MTETQDRRVSHKELTRVSFRCGKTECGAEITIDLAVKSQLDRFRARPEDRATSFLCPFCGRQFDSTLRAAMEGYRDFLYYMSLADQDAVFRLAEPGA